MISESSKTNKSNHLEKK